MKSTVPMMAERLAVPGANLYYEVRGSGPVLLIMPGGPADAGNFRHIAEQLAPDYTVVTYDPRGLSHSTLDGPVRDERIVEIFADDVHRLLTATAKEPAFVFASSGGAVIGLELATRHPEQVRTLVSHEPPAPALMADPARERAAMAEIVETYRTAGIGPAMQKLMVLTRNMDFWLGHYFLAIAAYEPDFAVLKAGSTRIVPAVGDKSRGELAHEGGLRLAERLGTQAVVFPGAHGGFESDAADFAVKLREVLQG